MSLSPESLQQIGTVFDTKVKGIVDRLEGRISKNEAKTQEAHTRLDGHEQRITRLEMGAGSGSGKHFKPTHVKILGICKFADRLTQGVDRQ